MTNESQADHHGTPEEAGRNQIIRVVKAAQECDGEADAEPQRTLDGHMPDEYRLTPERS